MKLTMFNQSKAEKIKGSLLPCPFCKSLNITICTCRDLGDCVNFETCEKDLFYTVVCDATSGGCGAASGYKTTIKAAVKAWNMRSN